MGGFDDFKRVDPEHPRYMFFPNRSRTQTIRMSWGVLVGCGIIGLFVLNMYERNADKLNVFYEHDFQQNVGSATKRTLYAQNEEFRDIFYRARRMGLGLPAKPPGIAEIREPDVDPTTCSAGQKKPW